MSRSSVVRAVRKGLSERVLGLRPNAPRRNALVVLAYCLALLLGIGLLRYLAVFA